MIFRFAFAALLATASLPPASAASSFNAATAHMSLFIPENVNQFESFCVVRDAATAEQTKAAVAAWRRANTEQLKQLRDIAAALEERARQAAFDPKSERTPKEKEGKLVMSAVLKMLAGAQAAATFGRANDQQAIGLCRSLRDDLSESGTLHTSLPEVIANGNLLLQIESQQK